MPSPQNRKYQFMASWNGSQCSDAHTTGGIDSRSGSPRRSHRQRIQHKSRDQHPADPRPRALPWFVAHAAILATGRKWEDDPGDAAKVEGDLLGRRGQASEIVRREEAVRHLECEHHRHDLPERPVADVRLPKRTHPTEKWSRKFRRSRSKSYRRFGSFLERSRSRNAARRSEDVRERFV
jgi:hypothetical protein